MVCIWSAVMHCVWSSHCQFVLKSCVSVTLTWMFNTFYICFSSDCSTQCLIQYFDGII